MPNNNSYNVWFTNREYLCIINMKGFRDFNQQQMVKRNYLENIIKSIFRKYGFNNISTPAIEYVTHQEKDKLTYKVDADKELRYDLTVPFARYVMENDVILPFKRFQIGSVWRGEKPQKGRYREFIQCDADIIGSNSIYCEIELLQMVSEILEKLGLNYIIKINNRKVLSDIIKYINASEKEEEICILIDKLDKQPKEVVFEKLSNIGINFNIFKQLLELSNNKERITYLSSFFDLSGSEIEEVLKHVDCRFEPTLARGLSYYTGTVFEIVIKDVSIGSIAGGGRYDKLVNKSGKNISGIGISLGFDRLYDAMEELNLFPEMETVPTVMVANFGESSLKLVEFLRSNGIASTFYYDEHKLSKQFEYANKIGVKYVLLYGENEMVNDKIRIKNMLSGKQDDVGKIELIKILSETQ